MEPITAENIFRSELVSPLGPDKDIVKVPDARKFCIGTLFKVAFLRHSKTAEGETFEAANEVMQVLEISEDAYGGATLVVTRAYGRGPRAEGIIPSGAEIQIIAHPIREGERNPLEELNTGP